MPKILYSQPSSSNNHVYKILKRFEVPTAFVFLVISIIKFYNGSLQHGIYYQIPQFFQNQEYFTQNFYIKESTFIYTTIFYPILGFFNIDIYNGFVSILIHFCLSGVSIYFCYKFIKEFITKNNYINYIIIVCLIYSDGFIISSIRSSPIFSHTLTPSHLAHSLTFPLFYFTSKHRWFIVSILSSISIAISIKVSWFPIFVTYIYVVSLLVNSLKKRIKIEKEKMWLFIPPIISMIIVYFSNQPDFSIAEKSEIFDFILKRDAEEDALHLNPSLRIFFLFFSFVIFGLINKTLLNKKTTHYNNILLLSTTILTFLGFIYIKFFGEIFPIPELVLLSPVRSLALFQIFFVVILVFFSIKKNNIYLNTFVLFYSLWVMFNFGSFNYSLPVLFSILIFSKGLFYFKNIVLKPNIIFYALLTITFMLLLSYNFYKPKFASWVGDKNIFLNKKINSEVLNASYKLVGYRDFPLLPVISKKINLENTLTIDNRFCVFSKKSEYLADSAHFYLDKNKQIEDKRRRLYTKNLGVFLSNPKAYSDSKSEILCEDIVIIGHKNIFGNLDSKYRIYNLNENIQMLPLGIYSSYNFNL